MFHDESHSQFFFFFFPKCERCISHCSCGVALLSGACTVYYTAMNACLAHSKGENEIITCDDVKRRVQHVRQEKKATCIRRRSVPTPSVECVCVCAYLCVCVCVFVAFSTGSIGLIDHNRLSAQRLL